MDKNSWTIKIISLIIYALILSTFAKFYLEKSKEQMRQEVIKSTEYAQVITLIKEKKLSVTKIKTATETGDYNFWLYFVGVIIAFLMFNVPYTFVKSIIHYFLNRKAQRNIGL